MAAEDNAPADKASSARDPRSYDASAPPKENDQQNGEDGHNGADADKPGSANGKAHKRKGLLQRPVTLAILIVVVLALLIGGLLYWLHARQFQSTDDAFIDTHLVRLAPQISGRVQKVLVEDNQRVEAGQALLVIDPRDEEARLSQAQAQKAQAEAQIAQAQAVLQQNAAQVHVSQATYSQNLAQGQAQAAQAVNASRDLARYLTLKSVNAAAVSQQQLDQAQAQAQSTGAQRDAAFRQAAAAKAQITATQAQSKSALAQIAAGRAQVDAAEAQIRSAQLDLSYTTVVAPEAGTVAQRSVAIGNYVNPGAQVMAIVPVRTWVTANFKETQLALMRAGQPASVHVDACPQAEIGGHVDSIQRGAGQAFGLLPPENATGNFVKVVQRVPVKILLDHVPRDCPLGPGLSVEPKVRVR